MTLDLSRRKVLQLAAMGGTVLALSGHAHGQGGVGVCSFSRRGPGGNIQNPTQYALNIFQQVMSSLGVNGLSIYQSYQVGNAAAYPGQGTVLYNPDFLNQLNSLHPAAPASVLAHEVGHFSQAGGYAPNAWTRELSADYISGVSMRRLNVGANESQAALRSMFNIYGSPTHPDTPRRLNAMMTGYANGY